MNIVGGIILLCAAAAMIFIARPPGALSHFFDKMPWIVGQLYVLTAMVIFIIGAAAVIANT